MRLPKAWLFASVIIGGTFLACTRQTTSTEQPAQHAQPQTPPEQMTAHPVQKAELDEQPAPERQMRPRVRPNRPATKADETPSTIAQTERPVETPLPPPAVEKAVEKEVVETKPATPPTPPPPPPPRTATLEAGTTISVRTTSSISTATAVSGDRFAGTLEKPINDGSWVIAPRGAKVEGVVAESTKGGRVKGKALLTLRLTSITTADGEPLKIETSSVNEEAKSQVKKDAAKVGIATGIGAAIGAIAGGGKGAAIGAGVGAAGGGGVVAATRGEAAEIPAETVLAFELASPVSVTERR